MNWKLLLIQFITIIGLSITIWGLSNKIQNQKEELSIVYTNLKAFEEEKDSLFNASRVFRYTIEELKASKDSLNKQLLETKKRLKIKDRNLKYLEYQLSRASKVDTVVFKDTIFINNIKIDTTFGDKWYNLKLGIYSPNTIIVEPTFNSEKTVIGFYEKETIKPPKKFFLWRLFQRKHKVVKVTIEEKNPYIIQGKERYIEIVE